ncbi:CBY1-interacting BAR domain-containing protein 1-B-like isoform X1 [Haliotis rufescens]|uniref:CBY1-interacting BAR domain-containing protein 1-B-like isoform X1 n=1 Tax=Haliotis rufescens TaxID=6454 RepID=UPI001EAFB55D|nr:CBY1-interacting BAR domain-containing protein 1-B-like isoform X1 [Haliotis rufescens]
MSRNANEVSARQMLEKQSKFCLARVGSVEKNFGLICETIGSITRKNARLRNKGDVLAGHIKNYADGERLNSSSKKALTHFAENFSTIQDYKNSEVHRMEAKVLQPMMQYGGRCKQMKATVKREISALKKERQTRQKLDKVRQKNPGDRHQITRAETEVQRASQDASIYSRALEDEMDRFEKEKVTDLKKVLTDFLNIEMTFHARALENLAKCFENVAMIDEFSDVEEFRSALMDTIGSNRQLGTMSSLGASDTFGSATLPSMGTTYSDRQQSVRMASSMYGDEDEEEEEDDEEDDDDEDDDPPTTSRAPRVHYA